MKTPHNNSLGQTLRFRERRQGVTLVESAVVLGVFAAILLGVLDLGLAVLRQNSLDATARRVARAAIVRGEMASHGQAVWGPTLVASRASSASQIATTARPALATINPHDVILVVDWPDGGNQLHQRVRVRMGYRHKSMFPLLYGSHLDLQSECVMRIAH
jgi:Flp pilus assembly protein TadG